MATLTRRQFIGTAAGRVASSPDLISSGAELAVNPRDAWAVDRPPRGPMAEEDVRFLIVHHSASWNGHRGADAPSILRSFYDYHTSPDKGWNDIAYNFLIDSEGGVWEGRAGSLDGPVAGDATGGNQGFAQLVCIIGDYDDAEPTRASLSSLVLLLAWLADRYHISTAPPAQARFTSRGSNRHPPGVEVVTPTITGHRFMSQTSCPGDSLNAYVTDGLMADVETLRTSLTPTTVPATTSAPTTSTPSPTSAPTSTYPGLTTIMVGDESVGGSGAVGIAAGAGIAAAIAALVMWRHRRMSRRGRDR